MKTKKTVIILMIASLVLISGFAACKHGHGPCGFDEFDLEAGVNRIASRLDLTKTQKADLDRMAREIAEKANILHTDREGRHQELADIVRKESIDRTVVDKRIAERMQAMSEMADFVSERLIAFHGTLTPEQREKVAQRIEKHGSKGCRFGFR